MKWLLSFWALVKPYSWVLLCGVSWILVGGEMTLAPVQTPLWAEAVSATTATTHAAPPKTKTLGNLPPKRKQRRQALWSIIIGSAIFLGAVALLWWMGALGLLGVSTLSGILLSFSIFTTFIVLLILSILFIIVGIVVGKPAGLFASRAERKAREAKEETERAERLAKVQYLPKRYIRRYIRLQGKFKTVQEILPRRREELAEDYAGATRSEQIEYQAALAELAQIEAAYQQDLQELEEWNKDLADLSEADRPAYQKLIDLEDYWKGRVEYHGERSDLRGLRLYQSARAKLEDVQRQMAVMRGE